jgi:REP element-mobilizing transposase RayT
VLVGPVAGRLSDLCRSKASELGGEVPGIAVEPDYVHWFCYSQLTLAPHPITCRFRAFTAHVLRRELPALNTRLPRLWTRADSGTTAGCVSAATACRYPDAQKGRL